MHSKVFCIGFQKTGTTSLHIALEQLGFRVASVFGHDWSLERLRRDVVTRGLEIAQEVDAVEDMPWPMIYQELDREFPGSKFILTERDPDKWIASLKGHFGSEPQVLQQFTYGEDAGSPEGNEERYLETYRNHNASVREYFDGREDDLLVMNLEHGDGWAELGAFLGLPVPEGPFVKTNTAAQRNSLVGRVSRKLKRVFG